MRFFQVLFALAVVALCSASPAKRHRSIPRGYMIGGSYYTNPRYARQGYEYIPPGGAMTAMVIGDTVATNSFAGSPGQVLSVPLDDASPEIEGDQSPEQITEKQLPLAGLPQEPESLNETEPQEDLPQQDQGNNVEEQEVLFSLESGTTETIVLPAAEPSSDPAAGLPAEAAADEAAPVAEDAAPEALAPPAPVPAPAPSPALAAPVAPAPAAPAPAPASGAPARKNKANKGKKPAAAPAADDDDDDSGSLPASWPFGAPGRGVPNYNAFFPIFIGGNSPSGRARTRSANGEEGNYPGSATAIANSFSTGKGGVATSHATSFGDPYAAAVLRNAGLFNSKFEA